ncbi:MAG: recombinase family protein [Bacilli bacterium]|nr:recombinase family protein [Bacilli bacterium]
MEVIKIAKKKQKNIYTEKLKVAAYIRVSTKLERQENSYESQYNYYKNRIEQNINWELVGIYGDDGITGTSIKTRDSFKKMIIGARKGNIDLILTKSISRFARNTEEALKYIRELRTIGVGIIFEEENINTLNMSSEFLLSVMASVAQLESNNARSRKKYSFDMQINDKNYKDRKVFYGYKKDKNGELIIDQKEANVVRKIFEMYLDGYNNAEIADYLNNQKIKTTTGIKWTRDNISRVLKNEKYTGTHVIRKHLNGEKKKIYNNNPAIISKDIYEKVIERKFSRRNRDYKKREKKCFLTGKIRCNYCGRVFSKTSINDNEYNWYCSNNIYRHRCESKGITVELVENAFVQLLINLYLVDTRSKISKTNNLEKRKDIFTNQLYLLFNQFLNKEISKLDYVKERKKIDNEIEKIDKMIIDENLKISIKEIDRIVIANLQNKIKERLSNQFDEELFDSIIKFVIIGDTFKNGRRDFFTIRFIGKDNFFEEDDIDYRFIINNKYRKIYQFEMETNFFIRPSSGKYKYIKKVKVSYELLEV